MAQLFAPHSKNFVSVGSDNRVNLWDTETRKVKRTYVEKNHLSHAYSCCDWFQSSPSHLGLFAVGCSDGSVIIWDFVRGVVATTISAPGQREAPSSVAFSHDGSTIFVSSLDNNHILQFQVSNGEMVKLLKTGKKGISRMVLNPVVEVLAVANSSIKLVDVASGRKRKFGAAVSGGVSSLAFSPCGCYLAAAGSSSREVLVFDAQATAVSSAPLRVVAVMGLPLAVSIREVEQGESVMLELLVTFENANASISRFAVGSEDSGGGENNSVEESQILSSSVVQASIFGAAGGDRSSSDGVMVALGSLTKPYFRHVSYVASDKTLIPKIEALAPGESLSSSGSAAAEEVGAEASGSVAALPRVLGPNETAGAKRPLLTSTEVIDESSERSKKARDGDELTLEQRLENLSSNINEIESQTRARRVARGSTEGGIDASSTLALTPTPTSDSLVTLIEQALQSGDDALLEQSLGCEDVSVVDATAQRLPVVRVVPFLRKLMAKFEKRPSRSSLLTHWLTAVLRHHTAFLVSVPDLSFQLAGLSQVLEQRLASYSKLAALGGRLDLLMQQVSNNSQAKSVATGKEAAAPTKVYREI